MELLRESSEITADAQNWTDFRCEIEQAWKDHCRQQAILEVQQHEQRQRQIEEQIARDRQFASQAAAATTNIYTYTHHPITNDNDNDGMTTTITTTRHHRGDDEKEDSEAAAIAKRALIERFGYDVPEDDDIEDHTASGADAILTNRQVAKMAEMERAQQLRVHKGGTATKKEEQQKTAQAKRNKQQIKEERRKRATKGERKR
jgi:hypothetical protein